MAKENKVINIIKARIQEAPNGTLFFNNSFPEFDDEYVGQILSDLAKEGMIHHLSRGVYLKTEETRFGLVYPPVIDFVPKGKTLEAFRRDYNDNMVNGYIYGSAMPFDALISRIEELQTRFRRVAI